MIKVFISYSHKDEGLRNELENHLAMLKRSGIIETWHDRRIIAGDELYSKISAELESAQIILLLVSADFLASNYCYDVEMRRALERHNDGTASVIPIILRPCDWHSSFFGALLATPPDGKAVTMFANQDEAFAIVAKDIRRATERFHVHAVKQKADESSVVGVSALNVSQAVERSSNLRIKKKFNDHERDNFLENAYEYITRFFEGSLNELQKRNSQITTKFKRVDAQSFTASIYANGDHVCSCLVVFGSLGNFRESSIRYSNSPDASRNSWNDELTVGDDGYTLHLQGGLLQGQNKCMTEEGAAEYYWGMFIRQLQ